MEESMISGGIMLCTVIDRYEATHEDRLKESAAKVYLGLKRCATQHGIPGFIARSLCLEDGTGFYHSSSRDQYTHCIHGLWRYYRSALSDEQKYLHIFLNSCCLIFGICYGMVVWH
jgi:hypothetical protein